MEQTEGQVIQGIKRTDEMVKNLENILAATQGVMEKFYLLFLPLKSLLSIDSVAEESVASSEEVSASTEEQSASLEEIRSAVEELSQLSRELNALLRHFRLDAEG